ncbi:EamA family transporter [Brevibacillus laterosporus]|uniref:EamA family transporter n=1 Tax=Brevibacillus laterosporus TaxID=1465 RepID=UPI003D25CD99
MIGKNILHHVPPFTLSFLRWSFALLVLLPFTWKLLRENWEIYLRFWKEVVVMGFLGIALFTGLVYWGMEHGAYQHGQCIFTFILIANLYHCRCLLYAT